MPKIPYTEKYQSQFRGPADSEKFNKINESVYEDLVYLYNLAQEARADIDNGFSVSIKDLRGLSKEIEELKIDLKNAKEISQIVLFSGNQIEDTDRFDGTSFEVLSSDRLYHDSRFKNYTLPRVLNSSISRLRYSDQDGATAIPPSLDMVVNPNGSSIESTGVVRTTLPYDAVIAEPGKVWERNVISDNPNAEAELDLMFMLPEDLSSTEYANVINLIPFPIYDVDLIGVYYTTTVSPNLSVGGTAWTPINVNSNQLNNADAVGYTPPGAWSGDEIIGCGPKSFIFPSTKITALRFTIRQTNPYDASGDVSVDKYIYSYGMSMLDVRYDKFESEGKLIYEITPNDGDTISSIDTVMPDIYNVGAGEVNGVFSYRVIWETSFDSGTYTTSPVPLSNRVWLEVTLKKDSSGNLPALTGFSVSYS